MFGFGRNKNIDQAQQNQPNIPQQQSPEILGDFSQSTQGQQNSFSPSFEQGNNFQDSNTRIYNPYDGLGVLDGRQIKKFKILDQPEFVFKEEAKQKRRGWSENLTFYTGVGALGGASIGGTYGVSSAIIGLRQQQQQQQVKSARLVANRLLNSTVGSGKALGNALGVLGLYFSSFESFFMYATRDYYFIPENLNTVAAGFATGALYRSCRGYKPAAITGLVGATIGAMLVSARQYYNYL